MAESGFTQGVIATSAAMAGGAIAVNQLASSAETQPTAGSGVAPGAVLDDCARAGQAGEVYQAAITGAQGALTTNQGVPAADDQDSLKAGARGSGPLEDFFVREKINHFDHERGPERVVHARARAPTATNSPAASRHTRGRRCSGRRACGRRGSCASARWPAIADRSSSPATSAGSRSNLTPVKRVGDLIGHFFIQHPIKFSNIIDTVRGSRIAAFPGGQSAHDTFWDLKASATAPMPPGLSTSPADPDERDSAEWNVPGCPSADFAQRLLRLAQRRLLVRQHRQPATLVRSIPRTPGLSVACLGATRACEGRRGLPPRSGRTIATGTSISERMYPAVR